MNEYRVTGELPVHDAKPGDTFEADLTAGEEATLVEQGRVEIVARPYKVVGPRPVHGAGPGEHFDAALTVDQETALVDAGHVQRSPRRQDSKQPAKQAVPIPAKTDTKE